MASADAVGDVVANGRLERGAEVGNILSRQRRDAGGGMPYRRLQAGERKMRIFAARPSGAASRSATDCR